MNPRLGGEADVGDAVGPVEVADAVPGGQPHGLPHVLDDVKAFADGDQLDLPLDGAGQGEEIA